MAIRPEALDALLAEADEHRGPPLVGRGPGRTITALAEVLRRLADEGQLQLDDPLHAAEQLNWLIVAAPLNRAMLLGDDEPLTPVQLEHHADAAVRVFLAACRR